MKRQGQDDSFPALRQESWSEAVTNLLAFLKGSCLEDEDPCQERKHRLQGGRFNMGLCRDFLEGEHHGETAH